MKLLLMTSPAMISILIMRTRSHSVSMAMVSMIMGRTDSYRTMAMCSRSALMLFKNEGLERMVMMY